MRNIRNPRYAPESLERKLSPSGFVHATVLAPAAPDAAITVCYGLPTPPPDLPPGDPTGPAGPA